jgi:hypothetical protein
MTNPAQCHCGSISWERNMAETRFTCCSCKRPLWQTMETAPKDGTEILVYGIANGELGGIHAEPEAWKVSWLFTHWSLCGGEGYSVWVDSPTHWMPLPEPPK